MHTNKRGNVEGAGETDLKVWVVRRITHFNFSPLVSEQLIAAYKLTLVLTNLVKHLNPDFKAF